MIVELVVSVIILSVFILLVGRVEGDTESSIEIKSAIENAKFFCNNNLMSFLEFDSGGGKNFRTLLQEAHALENPAIFSGPADVALDLSMDNDKWNMNIFSHVDERISTFERGISNLEGFVRVETCQAYVPVRCEAGEISDCTMIVELEVGYVK